MRSWIGIAVVAGGCGGPVQQRPPEPDHGSVVASPDAAPADDLLSTAGDPDADGFEDAADLCPFNPGTDQGCPSEVCRLVMNAVPEIATNFESVTGEQLSVEGDGRITKYATSLQVSDGTCVVEQVYGIGVFLKCELIATADESVAESAYRAWIDKLGTCAMDGWTADVEVQRDNSVATTWTDARSERRIELTKLFDKYWEEMGRSAYTVYFRIGKV